MDVFGHDDELLAFVPAPVLAVILLYPLTDESEARRLEELEQEPATRMDSVPDSLFYMKQTIGNACGTIALMHCLANVCAPAGAAAEEGGGEGGGEAEETVARQAGSFLDKFLGETAGMTPEAIGEHLEAGRGCAGSLHEMHGEAAQDGATRPPGVDEEINLHFVAFVEKDGDVWELDGRRAGPIRRGAVDGQGLMRSVARVVREEYVEKANGDLSFSLMALANEGG